MLGHRWVRTYRVLAEVVAVVLTVASCAVLYLLIGIVLPTLREPRPMLAFLSAVAVIVTVCSVRGVGRQRETALTAERPSQISVD